jgi:hypothetical protein
MKIRHQTDVRDSLVPPGPIPPGRPQYSRERAVIIDDELAATTALRASRRSQTLTGQLPTAHATPPAEQADSPATQGSSGHPVARSCRIAGVASSYIYAPVCMPLTVTMIAKSPWELISTVSLPNRVAPGCLTAVRGRSANPPDRSPAPVIARELVLAKERYPIGVVGK